MSYYILNIKITSQSLSSFRIELRAAGFHGISIYNVPDECRKNDAACRNNSQVVKLKIQLLQYLLVF